ncbi:hypothetical protein Poli38472_008931 [Pythium oligandrum]|uniref:Rab-GAP TBC domain-containing protein n=1 Tax=Pythium oligandrum TaxID=41045 RepID=A0A8K1C4I5_PYTOL|nr:hypothetical protein Poli38472_008931 [Pythium oligandrum]|eukprot:TMW56283.1 hypothetical protein Poli38472_008931 [Pythium oligandrum]
MDVRWAELKAEAKALAKDIGQSGRDHHSLAKPGPLLDAVRAQGIPAEHREWVWPILLHAHKQNLQRQSSSLATYNQLLEGVAEDKPEQHERSGLKQAHEMAMERFSHLNPFQERKIKRILLAYIKSKDGFYYCHGMVEICAVLSTFLSEEDAFWAFRLLLEVLLPKYHEESITDFQIDCLVLQELLERQDPALAEHLAVTGVTIQVLCTKWFFSFFAESMPFDLVCRLYDILLIDICCRRLSSKIIFSTAAAVFLYLSQMLQEMSDPSVIVEVMCEFCWSTLSDYSVAETFIDLVLFLHDRMLDEEIRGMRLKFKEQLEQEERARNPSKSISASPPKKNEKSRTLRSGKSQSIKLIIQWQKVDDDATVNAEQLQREEAKKIDARRTKRSPTLSTTEEDDSEVQLEIVATPTEKEVLAKVYQGIDKINRRRSRTSSLRNVQLLGDANTGLGSSPYPSRPLSLSGSVLSVVSSPRDQEELERASTLSDDEDASWEMLQQRGDPRPVVRRSLRGVPDEHRSWVWPVLLAQATEPKNFPRVFPYEDDADFDGLEQEVTKAIENDISRTRNLKESQYAPMRRVLKAFALRNRRVGYCQGMNELLAVFLQYLNEREALLGLSLLIETVLPSYHVDSMIGLHTDCAVMDTLLRQNDPELHAHLHTMGLNMEILCTKWLVTCFLTSLPPFCGLQVIDMLLARVREKRAGSRVLLGVGMSIFFTLRDSLLAAKDAGEILLAINEYFAQEMTKTRVEMESFLSFCHHVIDQLRPEIVDQFRLVHRDEVMERFAKFEAKKIEMRQQMDQVRARQQKGDSVPPSPTKSDTSANTSSSASGSAPTSSSSGTTVRHRKSFLSSYISMPLLGSSRGGSAAASNDDNPRDMYYQRVDVAVANRAFVDDLAKMDEQLEDLAELFVRGKIDEKEHACIKAQIVRKWCRGLNSPQSAMLRVQRVKAAFGDPNGIMESGNSSTGGSSPVHGSQSGNDDMGGPRTRKKSTVSLYGRMKKVKKSAIAIFKSTFE